MAQTCFSVTLREHGVTLVRARFCAGDDPFAALLAAGCEKWVRSALFDRARAAYEQDQDPKKRFYFCPFEYHFEATLTPSDTNAESPLPTLFHIRMTLRHGTALLSQYEEPLPIHISGLFQKPRKNRPKTQ